MLAPLLVDSRLQIVLMQTADDRQLKVVPRIAGEVRLRIKRQ